MNRKSLRTVVVAIILVSSFTVTLTIASASQGNEDLFKSWRSLIAPILDLQNRVGELEQRNQQLEQKVDELERKVNSLLPSTHSNFVQIEDQVSQTYDPGDEVAIVGEIVDRDDAIDSVTLIFEGPGGSTINTASSLLDDNGDFDFVFDIPNNAVDGVYTVKALYGDWVMYSYFIVDDEDDTISVELDNNDGLYEAGDEVTITGRVENPDDSEDNVVITIIDPTNDMIVDEELSELGAGTLDGDEFEFSFALDDDAHPGRYAVIVTYDVDDQEGGTLFEIPLSDIRDPTGDSDSDGDLAAQVEEDSYNPGDSVVVKGTIDGYDSDDNEDLSVIVENPDGDEVDDYGDDSVTVQNDGDFDYIFDLADDSPDGIYSITMTYADDQVNLTFEVNLN